MTTQLTIIVLLASCGLKAQQTYRFLPVKALSQSNASFVFKDSKNLVWIGTEDGVNVNTGKQTVVYRPTVTDSFSVAGSNIQSTFFEDPNKDIWFGTMDALNCFSRETGRFNKFLLTLDGTALENKGYYPFYLEKNRFLWVLSDTGLFRFDIQTKSSKYITQLRAARCGVECKNGYVKRIYACGWDYGYGVEILELGSGQKVTRRWSVFSMDEVDSPALTAFQAVIDDSGIVWVATDKGLLRFHSDSISKFTLFNPTPQRPLKIRNLAIENSNNILVTTNESPLYRFNLINGFQKIPIEIKGDEFELNGKADEIYLDNDGILWMSILGHGLSSGWIGSKPIKPKTDTELNVQGIMEWQPDCFWFFTYGIWESWLIDKDLIRKHPLKKPVSGFCKNKNGQICLISNNNLLIYDRISRDYKTVWTNHVGAVFYLRCFDEKSFFLLCSNGLFQYQIASQKTTPLLFGQNALQEIWIDKWHRTWVIEQTGKGRLFSKNGVFIDSLPAVFNNLGNVSAFHETRNHLYAGTSKGLLQINPETFATKLYDEAFGFPNQYIQSIVEDRNGILWLGNNRGILRFDPKNPTKFRQFTTSDGLSSEEYSPGAALIASNGEFWFGGKNGLDVFHPDSLHDIGHAPQLGLIDLKIHGKSWHGDSAIFVKQRLELDYTQNALTFDLAAMEYLDPAKNQFKCRLVGHDGDWVKLGTQDFITYANLPPDKYRFEFTACNAEGIWQEVPRTLDITIHPPWWQTTWFRFSLFILLVLMGYGIYRYRIAHLRREFVLSKNALENEKKALESTISALLAQMNPHFIFNSLNSINSFILKNKGPEASQYLHQFAGLMRQILDYSSMKSISLEQEIAFLNDYIAIESLRMNGRLAWQISLADDVDDFDTQIPPMILQPFVENAIWHGLSPKPDGGRIDIHFKKENGALVCSVEDNGIGRTAATASRAGKMHNSKGLSITADRLRLFDEQRGGASISAFKTIDLFDEKGQSLGTRVELRVGL